MTESHAIRVTMDFASLKSVVALWALECNKLLAYEHHETGKKVHCHFLVEGARACRKTFYNIFDRKFPGCEQQSWRAGKKFDGDYTYITYMSKGGNGSSLVYNMAYKPEYLEEMQKKWVAPEQYVKIPKQLEFYNNVMSDFLTDMAFDVWKKDNPKWQDEYGNIKTAKYKFLTKWCFNAAAEHNHGLITQKTWADYHMLIQTYCYKNSIPNPSFKHRMEK